MACAARCALRIAFDGEDDALGAVGEDAAAERLHGMERTRRRATAGQRSEHAAVERAAGVQEDLAAAFRTAQLRERARDGGEGRVGCRQQNDIGGQRLAREARQRLARAHGSHGPAGRCPRPGDDRADPPAQLVQTPAERAAHAPCADDGNRAWHVA